MNLSWSRRSHFVEIQLPKNMVDWLHRPITTTRWPKPIPTDDKVQEPIEVISTSLL